MLKKISYTLWIGIFLIIVLYSVFSAGFNSFLQSMENKTFDVRQSLIVNSGFKKPNQDIIIVAVDDASYEYILDKYGEWPMPREIYANLINYIEAQNPKTIAFDMMFVKSLKSSVDADELLAATFKKYKNMYTAMNLDNQSVDVRNPAELPESLSFKVKNNSKNVDFDSLTFLNCRTILKQIIDATNNIGMINVSRADDGILRKMPVFVVYKDKFYPQLAFKTGLGLLEQRGEKLPSEYVIDSRSRLIVNNRKLYLDNDGSVILNWYGATGTYRQIPIYKLIDAMEGKTSVEYSFQDKIVYFGTTAASLFDIKTVPVAKIYPGVEVQATYVNNLLDNSFIRKANKFVNVFVGILLAVLVGYLVINITSPLIITVVSLIIYVGYIVASYMLMKYCNLWIGVVYPVLLGVIVFISAFLVKYIIKSRDFDQQYKLATTDGLTELYNHRYFQEQMRMHIEHSKRYGMPFSLIIIDIDFFKKFNDTYGHQAGDAVLKQVAQLLKSSVRTADIVCRYGGEEMSIILPNTPKDISVTVAEKICNRVAAKKFKINNTQESNVTISLGVSTYPDDGDTPSEIIEAADKKLYKSKNNGRNQVN